MPTTVTIHQPNYLPWLGYFYKISAADVFIFLDDAQFSKNGYINRVQVMSRDGARWLTVPVSVHLGDPINRVQPAREDWAARHLDTLIGMYRGAPAFRSVWPRVKDFFHCLPKGSLAESNRFLVERIAGELGLSCKFMAASELAVGALAGDDRLVALVAAATPGGCYLSGRGGEKYQDPAKFSAAGLQFRYSDFHHPAYDQGRKDFTPGLSIMDAVFRLGWAGAAELIQAGSPAP